MVIVPTLVYRLARVDLTPETAGIWNDYQVIEILSWWKAVAIVAIAAWMLFHMLVAVIGGWRPRVDRPLVVLAGAAMMTGVSTAVSDYPTTALLGYPGLYEGGLVLGGYLATVLFVAYFPMPEGGRLLLMRTIGVVSLINAGIGVFQGLGWDLWQSSVGRRIAGINGLEFVFTFSTSRMASGTSYQPNHFGMFVAMAGMVALAMLLREQSRLWKRLWAIILATCIVAALFSQSRAALAVLVLIGLGQLVCYFRTARFARKSLSPQTDSGNGWNRKAVFSIACVLAVLLLYFGGGSLWRSVATQWRRTTMELTRHVVRSPLRTLELHDNRIFLGLDSGMVSLGRRDGEHWDASREQDGKSFPLEVQEREWPDGRKRMRLPAIPGLELNQQASGDVFFRYDDIRANFFSLNDVLFAVDFDDRLHEKMTTPGRMDVHGLERLGSGRLYIWSRSLALVPLQPWFGSGPGTFGLVFPNASVLDMQRYFYRQFEDKPHGLWMGLLVQLGLAGFVFFVALFACIVYNGMVSPDPLARAAAVGVVAYGMSALTNDSTVGVTPVFTVLCGICLAGRRYDQDGREISYAGDADAATMFGQARPSKA